MASGVYTLPTPTANVWNLLQLPPDSVAIMFKNDSTFDFLLVFGGTVAPSFVTSPGGQANAFVNALEYPVIYTQRRGVSDYEQRLNGVGAWDGNLWYMAQDNTGGLATTGTISGRTVLNVMAYGPNDPVPPSGQAVTRQVDVTSQLRSIAIPMTPFFSVGNVLAVTPGADAGFFPDFVANTIPGSDTGVVIYIYYVQVNPSVTDGSMAFSVRLRVKDHTNPGIVLATFDVLYGFTGKTGNLSTPWIFAPATPLNVTLTRGSILPANAGVVEIDIHDFASPNPWACHATILADSDTQTPGQVGVPGIGGGIQARVVGQGGTRF
jgi:hypothetical protein